MSAEADLVSKARSGDRSAFEELVRQTSSETYTLALRLTGNEEDARDVVQETYLRAYKGLKRFRGEARFSTWLYRITANCASNQLSKRRRHRHEVLDDDGPLADLRPDVDPAQLAEAALERERVGVAVEELPEALRTVIVLRDVYDLSHDAIAKELGISEGAAKVRLHRARQKLREQLYPLRGEASPTQVVDEGDAHAV